MPLTLKRDELARIPDELPIIQSIHKNRELRVPILQETRPFGMEDQDLLISTWGLQKTNAMSVWGAYGTQGQGTKVGILDTGVDGSHPDLDGKVVNWAEFDSMGQPVSGSSPNDSGEHGTHVSGTVVGGKSSGRFIGIAPDANIAAALVLKAGRGSDAQVLAGMDWALE